MQDPVLDVLGAHQRLRLPPLVRAPNAPAERLKAVGESKQVSLPLQRARLGRRHTRHRLRVGRGRRRVADFDRDGRVAQLRAVVEECKRVECREAVRAAGHLRIPLHRPLEVRADDMILADRLAVACVDTDPVGPGRCPHAHRRDAAHSRTLRRSDVHDRGWGVLGRDDEPRPLLLPRLAGHEGQSVRRASLEHEAIGVITCYPRGHIPFDPVTARDPALVVARAADDVWPSFPREGLPRPCAGLVDGGSVSSSVRNEEAQFRAGDPAGQTGDVEANVCLPG